MKHRSIRVPEADHAAPVLTPTTYTSKPLTINTTSLLPLQAYRELLLLVRSRASGVERLLGLWVLEFFRNLRVKGSGGSMILVGCYDSTAFWLCAVPHRGSQHASRVALWRLLDSWVA